MRYRFIDRVVSLELGATPRIEVTKTFAATDDGLSGPHGPLRVPTSLVLELLAMTGGHLLARWLGGTRLPLLLKVAEFRVERPACPGEPLSARVTLGARSGAADGAAMAETSGDVYQGSARIAAGRLTYVCVRLPGIDLNAYLDRP
jgi:3-hydroxymyristoyl/3-hydroxydecanoyl-(acyl carrier protein) dehydratase